MNMVAYTSKITEIPMVDALLGSIGFHQFLENYHETQVLVVRGTADCLSHQLNWRKAESLISRSGHREVSYIGSRGESLHKDPVPTFENTKGAFSEGKAVRMHRVELSDKFMLRIASGFKKRLASFVEVDCLLTPGNFQFPPNHLKLSDRFIIQTSGSMTYEFGEGMQQTITLKAGDCLYIPSGFSYQKQSGDHSFEIAVKILNRI
jgi:mannose-6-phosphate isomerase-like protein (cupin superfamily)